MSRHFSILLIILILPFISISQQAPNADFETWNSNGNYAQPASWSTPNPSSAGLGIYTVTKETTWVQSGGASAKLQTRSALGFKIPGLLTLGTFDINLLTMEATITGGTAFTGRPSSLTGYLQYQPKSGDNCFIGVLILRKNGTSWDTLGTGEYTNTSTLNSWNQFVIPITYTSASTPTHLNIIIMSSDKDNPQTGSILYIDNLSFQYAPVGISKADGHSNIHAFYSNSKLKFAAIDPFITDGTLELFSIDGRLVHREILFREGNHLFSSSLQHLVTGIYVVYLTTKNEQGEPVALRFKQLF